MSIRCQHCGAKSEKLKRCASCGNVWYCDPVCQKKDWPIHLLNCNIGRPITTADRLGAAVCQGLAPTDTQTRRDYGYTQTPHPYHVERRMQVYKLLIQDLGVKTKSIHSWKEAGVLGKMIQHTFDTRLLASQREGGAYKWLSATLSSFDNPPPGEDGSAIWSLDAHCSARALIARSTSRFEFDKMIEHDDFEDCFLFFTLLLQGARPNPRLLNDHWVKFGFCGCSDQDEEAYFADQYLDLFRKVTFKEFLNAYTSATLPRLFSAKGWPIHSPFILDVLSEKESCKSVWNLKDFVCADDETLTDAEPVLPVCVDYGFFNCDDADEEKDLRAAYKRILDQPSTNPLALHEACLRGELFEYCCSLTYMIPSGKFRRLMRNPYPLRPLEEVADSVEGDGAESQTDGRLPGFSEIIMKKATFASDEGGRMIGTVSKDDLRAESRKFWRERLCKELHSGHE